MARQLARLVALVLATTGTGCADEIALSVDLRTNLVPGVEFAAVTVELIASPAPPGARASSVTAAALRTHDFYGGRRVAEYAPVAAGEYDVRVELADSAGRVVARRVVSLTMRADYALVVIVSRDCRDVTCPGPSDAPSASTCFGGRCVDPRCIDGSSVTECGIPECVADTDCPALSACSRARCVASICFYEARDELCAAGEECGIEVGCHPAVATDAGRPDAGASDAGAFDAARPDAAGCMPDCSARTCGPDPRCGVTCGTCGPAATCGPDGSCMCAPDCAGRECGTDPRCGTSCGTCGAGTLCNAAGSCECAPDCTGRDCDVDPVCGASCGTCGMGDYCSAGVCIPTGGTTICVAGDIGQCRDSRETWSGSLCCVSDVKACLAGDVSNCSDSAEHWTGAYCCVDAPAACSSNATFAACLGTIYHWTGTWCCVTGAGACGMGTVFECDDPGEHWVGGSCCVDGVTRCAPGTAGSCTGHWTGAYCCT